MVKTGDLFKLVHLRKPSSPSWHLLEKHMRSVQASGAHPTGMISCSSFHEWDIQLLSLVKQKYFLFLKSSFREYCFDTWGRQTFHLHNRTCSVHMASECQLILSAANLNCPSIWKLQKILCRLRSTYSSFSVSGGTKFLPTNCIQIACVQKYFPVTASSNTFSLITVLNRRVSSLHYKFSLVDCL